MDFKTFSDFYSSVSEHNYHVQKYLEKESNVLTIKDIKEQIAQYPLAEFYLHYPKDEQTTDLVFCYSISSEGPTQLLPILSSFVSEDKIILSYLKQKDLDKMDFSDEFKIHEHYVNSAAIVKTLFNNHRVFSPQEHSMIFMEHIPDTLNWNSDSQNHKIHQPFSMIFVRTLMLWDGYYFTPHY